MITLIEYMQNFIQPPDLVAKEKASADHPGTFLDLSGHIFEMIRTLFRSYRNTPDHILLEHFPANFEQAQKNWESGKVLGPDFFLFQ